MIETNGKGESRLSEGRGLLAVWIFKNVDRYLGLYNLLRRCEFQWGYFRLLKYFNRLTIIFMILLIVDDILFIYVKLFSYDFLFFTVL